MDYKGPQYRGGARYLESRGADHDKGKRRMAPSEHGIDSPGTLDGHRTLGFVSAALNSGPLASGEMT